MSCSDITVPVQSCENVTENVCENVRDGHSKDLHSLIDWGVNFSVKLTSRKGGNIRNDFPLQENCYRNDTRHGVWRRE